MQQGKGCFALIFAAIALAALALTSGLHRHLLGGVLPGYTVHFSADDMYSVDGFELRTELSSFTVEEGFLVPGTTRVGATVVIVIGEGVWTAADRERYAWKNLAPGPGGPELQERFDSLYLRIHPRYYDELLAGAVVEKSRNLHAFALAREIYRRKFRNSYHFNQNAIIPSADVGTIDIESQTWGRLWITEQRGHGFSPSVHRWPSDTWRPGA